MAKKPVLFYAVVRGVHFSDDFVVVRVMSERLRQFSGVEVGNITSTTRSMRDLIAKFDDEETATGALAAYRERWNAHKPLIVEAERRLSLERTNRQTSAMDALKAYQTPTRPPLDPVDESAARSDYGDSVAEETPIEPGCAPGEELPPFNHEHRAVFVRGISSEADDNGE
jgi:hypothetical protein